jgi:hypothetical protein
MKRIGELSFGALIGANSLIMLCFMVINSFVCPGGFTGSECVKNWDSRIFFIQGFGYVVLSIVYLFNFDRRKWLKLLLGLLTITVIYVVAATLHSITKAGMF